MALGYLVRAGASLGATVLGALLLLADGGPDKAACETYGAYRGSYDYTNGCPLGARLGHVAFSWGAHDETLDASEAAEQQLVAGGLAASFATVDYLGRCEDGEGYGTPEDIRFQYGGESGKEYSCGALHLRRSAPQTVTCTRLEDAGVSDQATCTMTFTPAP